MIPAELWRSFEIGGLAVNPVNGGHHVGYELDNQHRSSLGSAMCWLQQKNLNIFQMYEKRLAATQD